jgi:hypothetical protein
MIASLHCCWPMAICPARGLRVGFEPAHTQWRGARIACAQQSSAGNSTDSFTCPRTPAQPNPALRVFDAGPPTPSCKSLRTAATSTVALHARCTAPVDRTHSPACAHAWLAVWLVCQSVLPVRQPSPPALHHQPAQGACNITPLHCCWPTAVCPARGLRVGSNLLTHGGGVPMLHVHCRAAQTVSHVAHTMHSPTLRSASLLQAH